MKPKEQPRQIVPFSATTTNQEMFSPKEVGPRMKRRPNSPAKKSLPFDGTTTNHDQFHAHPESRPRESMAPVQRMLTTTPFDGTTAYKADYPVHEIDGSRKKAAEHAPYDYGPARNLATEQRAAFTEKPLHLCPALFLAKKDPSAKTGHVHYTKKHHNPAVTYSATLEA